MQRRNRVGRAIACGALASAALLSACTTTGDQRAIQRSAPAAPTDPGAAAALPETGTNVTGDGCTAQAEGPWTNRTTDADLFASLRAGAMPPFLDATDGITFEVREYPTVDDYDDPSTIQDPAGLRAAWAAAGYQEGVDWRHGDGGDVVSFSLIRFRDDGGARAALSALLADYCSKAYESKILDDRSGMTVVRQTGAVRTMFVVDDTLVSVMSCGCYGDSELTRRRMVEDWASRGLGALEAADASSSSS